jgi:hypothetical protein
MYALMSVQTTFLTERPITDAAAKWSLPTMYALMSVQITVLTE